MIKQIKKRVMVLAGIFLFTAAGAASGQQADLSSPVSASPSSGVSGTTNPVALPVPTATGSQTVRGPIMANRTAPQAPAAYPPDPGASTNGDIRDIRGPLHIPDSLIWLYYGVAGCLFLLVSVLIWKWVVGRKKARVKLPFERAFEQLERAKGFMKPETAGKFSIMVSSAVRTYIENRFEMEMTRHTTEEFMRYVTADPSGEIKEYGDLLNGFLSTCDLVKFARRALTVKQMEEMLRSAWNFVDATKPSMDDRKAGQKAGEGEPVVDHVGIRKRASLMKRWWGNGFRFTSKKTTVPASLDHHGAVAAGGR